MMMHHHHDAWCIKCGYILQLHTFVHCCCVECVMWGGIAHSTHVPPHLLQKTMMTTLMMPPLVTTTIMEITIRCSLKINNNHHHHHRHYNYHIVIPCRPHWPLHALPPLSPHSHRVCIAPKTDTGIRAHHAAVVARPKHPHRSRAPAHWPPVD